MSLASAARFPFRCPPGSRPFTAALPPFHAPLCLDFFVGRSPSSLSIPWLTFFAFLDAVAIFFWSARHFRGDPKPARAGFWLLEAGYEPVGSEKMGISRPPQYRACIPPITTKTQFSSRYRISPLQGHLEGRLKNGLHGHAARDGALLNKFKSKFRVRWRFGKLMSSSRE